MSENDYHGLFIAGEFRDGEDSFEVEDPSREERIATVAEGGKSGIDQAITAAEEALAEWRWMAPAKRSEILYQVGDYLQDHVDELASLETAETGRPISQSQAIISDGVGYFDYYAGVPTKIEGETIPVPGERFNYTRREPLGVTGHIVPWNASVMLGIRSIVPALACGNTVVAKPSSEAPLSLIRFAELASEAGLPDGVLNVVPGSGRSTGEPLSTDSRVNGLTFTGSLDAGKIVGKTAMENVIPVNLELGGKSPCIIFPNADLEKAVLDTLKVYMNTGQVCFATMRVFVHEDIYGEFTEEFSASVESMSVGPGDEDPDIGPLISADALRDVAGYVDSAVANGARIHSGGHVIDRSGHFYAPTFIDQVDDDAPISCDEVFGPVVTAYRFSSEEEVVRRANDTEYGLYAAVWTDQLEQAHRVAHRLEAGTVTVNEYPATFPQAPFGGYKKSGIGREKGLQAIEHFTQLKTINISLGNAPGTVFDR